MDTVYIKLNCIPASSAAVERLFCASVQVLTARRCRMQNKTLDMHIFLRSIFKHRSMTMTIPDNLGARQPVSVGRQ